MKITRRELNILIESYLETESALNEVQIGGFKVAEVEQCDFKPDSEFLEYFTIMFTGKGTPRGAFKSTRPDELPTWVSPAFIEMFTDAAGPLLNAYGLIPVFNQKGKCDLLQKIQDIFIKYKRAYGEGIVLNKKEDKEPCPKPGQVRNAAGKCVDSGDIEVPLEVEGETTIEALDELPRLLNFYRNRYGIKPPTSSDSAYLGRSSIPGVSSDETVLATAILGSLDSVPVVRASKVYANLERLKGKRRVSAEDIVAASRDLDNEQKEFLKRLFTIRNLPDNKKDYVVAMMAIIKKLESLRFFK